MTRRSRVHPICSLIFRVLNGSGVRRALCHGRDLVVDFGDHWCLRPVHSGTLIEVPSNTTARMVHGFLFVHLTSAWVLSELPSRRKLGVLSGQLLFVLRGSIFLLGFLSTPTSGSSNLSLTVIFSVSTDDSFQSSFVMTGVFRGTLLGPRRQSF